MVSGTDAPAPSAAGGGTDPAGGAALVGLLSGTVLGELVAGAQPTEPATTSGAESTSPVIASEPADDSTSSEAAGETDGQPSAAAGRAVDAVANPVNSTALVAVAGGALLAAGLLLWRGRRPDERP